MQLPKLFITDTQTMFLSKSNGRISTLYAEVYDQNTKKLGMVHFDTINALLQSLKFQVVDMQFYPTVDKKERIVIRQWQTDYFVGDMEAAKQLALKLNEAHRPNIEERADGLYICWNFHERSEPCDYEKVISYPDEY